MRKLDPNFLFATKQEFLCHPEVVAWEDVWNPFRQYHYNYGGGGIPDFVRVQYWSFRYLASQKEDDSSGFPVSI